MKRYSLHRMLPGMLPFIVAACATGGPSVTVTSSEPHIVILYASDLHSQLVEGPEELGGYARLQTLVNKERALAGPKTDVLLVLGGDSIGKGRLPCRKTNDAKCAPLVGMLKPDVVTFGNAELKVGQAELQALAAQIGGVWVGSNVELVNKQRPAFWKNSYLFVGPKSGLKVNFVASSVFPGPGEARSGARLDFVETSTPFSEIYAKYGFVTDAAPILVVHDDLRRIEDIQNKICSTSQPPLLVLKGHEHKVDQGRRGCLKYLEADAFGRHVARMELVSGGQGYRIKNIKIIPVDSSVIAEPKMAEKVDALYKAYGQGAMRTVFNLSKPVDEDRVAKFLALVYKKTSKADIAIVNRGAIKQGFPAGKVDWDTVLTAVPYNNSLVGLDLKAGDLEKALCQASKRTIDRHLDNGSELIFAGAELHDAGKDSCRLVVLGGKKIPKVVVDSYMLVRSARWLGKELKGRTFSYGLDTERALELGIERHGKEL